jgi:hypothetical protein
MLTQPSETKTLSGLRAVTPVPRKLTMAGGFEVPTAGLPAKPTGRTGAGGELLKPELADAEDESRRLYFELQHMVAMAGEELFSDRHVVADERLLALIMRADDLRKYVQVLAKKNLVAFKCSRCRTAPTDDPKGDCMCPLCVEMAYGRRR